MKATPELANMFTVPFEDFVLDQAETLKRLEEFIGIPLASIIVQEDPVSRWIRDNEKQDFDFFADAMQEHTYNE